MWIDFLDGIEESGYYVVTARSLSTTQDYTHVDRIRASLLAFYELHDRHSVCVGEHFLYHLLISNACRCLTFHKTYCCPQANRQNRREGISDLLENTFLHKKYFKLFVVVSLIVIAPQATLSIMKRKRYNLHRECLLFPSHIALYALLH